jgi:hypothetical protein
VPTNSAEVPLDASCTLAFCGPGPGSPLHDDQEGEECSGMSTSRSLLTLAQPLMLTACGDGQPVGLCRFDRAQPL